MFAMPGDGRKNLIKIYAYTFNASLFAQCAFFVFNFETKHIFAVAMY